MAARDPRFPVPDRRGSPISRVKGDDGLLDLGWREDVMSDGRPYRAELWVQDQITILTFLFSKIGLESLPADTLFALMETEGLVRLKPGMPPSFQVETWNDGDETEFWSVNVTVGTDETTLLADSVAVQRYAKDGPNSVFRRG